jgi:hypothetical protein
VMRPSWWAMWQDSHYADYPVMPRRAVLSTTKRSFYAA